MLSHLCTPSFPLSYGSSLQETRWKNQYLLRRTKEMVPGLPPLKRKDVWLDMNENEQKWYSDLEFWAGSVYNRLLETDTLGAKYQKILLVLVRLRQACDHPLLQNGYAFTSRMLEGIKTRLNIEEKIIKIEEEEEEIVEKPSKKRLLLDEEEELEMYSSKNLSEGVDFLVDDDRIESKKSPKKRKLQNEPKKQEKVKIKDADDEIMDKIVLSSFFQYDAKNATFEYSTKIEYLKNKLRKIFAKDATSKVVIVTQFRTMLDLLECMLLQEGHKVLRYDGKQKTSTRSHIVNLFDNDPEYRVMIVSLKVGGVGLNLVSANKMFQIDPWWNSSVELQAFDRVHRIGQKRPVTVYRLLIRCSIEEEVLEIQKKKNNQENSFFDISSRKILSIGDIQCVFNTMRVRQSKANKQN